MTDAAVTHPGDSTPSGKRATAVMMLAAFGAYFSMYAFRKPVTATEFSGVGFLDSGVDLKTALMVGQVVGYAVSKYLGIIVCSSLSRSSRGPTLVGLVLVAEVALVAFALAPHSWGVAAMFLNGLPLGMVWGLVVRYLEGRQMAEVLLAALSVSFIVSSGVVKDVGRFLMTTWGVTEAWMPAATGALFLLPFMASVLVLERSPEPSAGDERARVKRLEMHRLHRREYARRFGPALLPLLLVFFFLTAYRDFRDNYGIEVFAELGHLDTPALFTRTELPASLAVLAALAALVYVKDHRRALLAVYALMVSGLAIIAASTAIFAAGHLGGVSWMILTGIGSYLAYVPVGAVLFERLTAVGGSPGTAVFGIYVADSIGYTGSVAIQIFKDLGQGDLSRLAFLESFSHHLAVWGAVGLVLSLLALGRTLDRGLSGDLVVQPDSV